MDRRDDRRDQRDHGGKCERRKTHDGCSDPSKKIFNMLNRVAITDGTYQAWREATYGIRSTTLPESPIFCGGMQSEIAFDEIVSNSATEEEPLGTLAGRGIATMYKSGRGLKIKCTEPSIIMALGSITPRVDYSQGNNGGQDCKIWMTSTSQHWTQSDFKN